VREKSKARAGEKKYAPARSTASMGIVPKRRDAVIVGKRVEPRDEQIPGYYLG
jgi:hypothetical protein